MQQKLSTDASFCCAFANVISQDFAPKKKRFKEEGNYQCCNKVKPGISLEIKSLSSLRKPQGCIQDCRDD